MGVRDRKRVLLLALMRLGRREQDVDFQSSIKDMPVPLAKYFSGVI
jgi:hypothetical protein